MRELPVGAPREVFAVVDTHFPDEGALLTSSPKEARKMMDVMPGLVLVRYVPEADCVRVCLAHAEQDKQTTAMTQAATETISSLRAALAAEMGRGELRFVDFAATGGVLARVVPVLGRLALGGNVRSEQEADDLGWLASRLRWAMDQEASVPSDTNMPDLLPDAVLFALYDIRKAGQSEGHPLHVGSHKGDAAIAEAITAILEYENEVRAAELARVVAAIVKHLRHTARGQFNTVARDRMMDAAYDVQRLWTTTAAGEG